MRAVIPYDILRAMMSHARAIPVEVLNIEYLPEGWRIRTMDSGNVAITEIHVWSTVMEEYEVSGEGITCCLPYERLSSLVSVLRSDCPVTVTDDGDIVTLESGLLKARIRQFGEFKEVKVPQLQYAVSLELSTVRMEGVLTAPGNGQEVQISCDPSGLRMSMLGDAMEGMEYYDPENGYDGPLVSARYSRDFLVRAFKHITGPVLMEYGQDRPLKISVNKPFTTAFIMAPLVHEEGRMG